MYPMNFAFFSIAFTLNVCKTRIGLTLCWTVYAMLKSLQTIFDYYEYQSVLCRMIAWTILFLSSRLYNMNVFHSTWSCLNYKIFACSHFCGLIISIQQMNIFSKGLLIFNSRINDLSTLGEKQICRVLSYFNYGNIERN